MGYPTFLDVPPEVRRYIYEYIFAGLELDVSDIKDLKDQRYVHEQVYADDTGPSRKFSPGAILEPYFAATSILLVNRHIRSEALPLFEENLTLILSSIRELQLAEKFFHNAHLVRLRIMALMPIPPDTIRRHLPQVKRITYEAANLYPWEDLESLVCDTWEDLFRILKGQKDADLLDDYRKWMSHAMASPGAFKMFADSDPPACEVVFEFANLYITWRDCESKSLAFLYRFDFDPFKSEVIYRAINLGYNTRSADRWVPAEGVLILTDCLKRPTLLRPDTREVRVLLGREDSNPPGPSEPPNYVKMKRKVYPGILDHQKRRKHIDEDLINREAIQESEFQLLSAGLLDRAVVSAERCVSDQTVDTLADALKVLATTT